LTTYFYKQAVQHTKAAIANALAGLRYRGLIAIDDLEEAAEMIRGMMAMDPQRVLMLGIHKSPNDAEIRARARRCAHLFVNGCVSPRTTARAR
jgi:hypothetical protein